MTDGAQRRRTALIAAAIVLALLAGILLGLWLPKLLASRREAAAQRSNDAAVLRCTALRPRWYHWLARPLLAAALMGLCCWLLFDLLERAAFGPLWSCLICAALGLAVYAASMLAQGASPGDYLPRLRRRGDAPC